MAHNLHTDELTNETSIFCVGDRDAAWHKLGQRVPNVITWQEARKLAHLEWEPVTRPIFARPFIQGSSTPLPIFQLPDTIAVFRNDTGAYLGTVGNDYKVLENRLAFDGIDTLLAARNGAHYESAGVLGKGEKIWVMARIPEEIRIKGTNDISKMYLLAATAHDGSMSYQFSLVAERVVCENTLRIALGEAGSVVRIKHTKNAVDRMTAAIRYMAAVTKTTTTLNEKLNVLAGRMLTRESATAIFDRLFPVTDTDANQTRRENLLAQVMELYEANDNNAIPEIRGTAYNMLNAITEYTDHFRNARITDGRKSDGYTVDMARAENALFGTGDRLKTNALNAILELTAEAPSSMLALVS